MIQTKINIYAPIDKVWKALTEQEQFKNWYFNIKEFKLEEGFEYSFFESDDSQQFLHVCRIKEIIPNQVFAHSWAYPNQSKGDSIVTWKLKEDGNKTVVTLTHEGLESFTDGGDAFAPENFQMGWEGFLAILKNYVNGIKKLKFEIEIKASAEKVWNVLWDEELYKTWAAIFHEGSFYRGSLKPGGRVQFVSPELDGIYSNVVFFNPNEFVLFQHLGDVKAGEELPIDEEKNYWSGCFEQYALKENNGSTLLKVEVDIVPDHESYFQDSFPKALQKIKELSENN